MLTENVTSFDTWVGVTVGFLVGLTTLNGLETLIEYVIDKYNKFESQGHTPPSALEIDPSWPTKDGNPNYNSIPSPVNVSKVSSMQVRRHMNICNIILLLFTLYIKHVFFTQHFEL